jgi:hypothetical protein
MIDRAIFDSGLSVESISLYLLCCGLIDAGIGSSLETIRARWTASEEALQQSLDELVEKRILLPPSAESEPEAEFRPADRCEWRL